MARTTTRPSGLELTEIDEKRIDWAYPPSGPNAKGMIVRKPRPGDVWSVSHVGSLWEGRVRMSPHEGKLEQFIAFIEREIKSVEADRQRKATDRQRQQEEREAEARQRERQVAGDEQELQDFRDNLFK